MSTLTAKRTEETTRNENMLIRLLFVKYVLKWRVTDDLSENGGNTKPSIVPRDTLLEQLGREMALSKIFLDKKSSRRVITVSSKLITDYFDRDRKTLFRVQACCCFDVAKTCNMYNAWPRVKLLCSCLMTYLDLVTDALTFAAILDLVGEVPSRSHWIVWSLLFIFFPSFLHGYYMTCCHGWRERNLSSKFKFILGNILFLRPLIELFKSCQVSTELENLGRDDWKDNIRIAMNITDDFKSESFIIYKVFEVSAESMPQIFLRTVILAKSWDHWTANMSEVFESNESNRQLCSNQTIFFFSLGLNFVQIAVTLQDLMERDVPYGVFPHALSRSMRQPNRVQSCKWQLAMFVYYFTNILERVLAWVPFVIFYGFKGFIYVFLFALLLRYILVAFVLGRYKCSNQENLEDKFNWQQQSCYFGHVNAMFAETLPWIMLAVFVDLPLSMAGLRSHSQKKTQVYNSGSRYRDSRSFFLLSHILSVVENMVLFVLIRLLTVEDGVMCGTVDVDRSKKLLDIEQRCRPKSIMRGNYTYFECTMTSGEHRVPQGFWKTFQYYYTVYVIAFFIIMIAGGVLQCILYRMLKFQGMSFASQQRTSIEMTSAQEMGRRFQSISSRMSIAEASAIAKEVVIREERKCLRNMNSWRDPDEDG